MSHRTQLLLEDWQYERLLAQSRRRGASLGSLVREAVSLYLGRTDATQDSLAGVVGLGASGRADVAEEHDRHLYHAPKETPPDEARVRRHERLVRAGRPRRSRP